MQSIHKQIKTSIITVLLLLITIPYTKAAGEDLSPAKYDRNGLSVVIVTHGDPVDYMVRTAHNTLEISNKFDYNPLHTVYYPSYIKRNLPLTEEYRYEKPIKEIISENELPKEIMSYCFMRDETEGVMSTDLILKRGQYNAIDSEYLLADATKVGISTLGDNGFELLDNNYILVLDYYKTELIDKIWRVKLAAYVYKVNYNQSIEDAISNAWISEDDNTAEKANKIAAFDNINFTASFVTSVKTSGSCSIDKPNHESQAIHSAYSNATAQLERQIEAWMVKTSIVSTNPILAKIGSKEGVGNKDRFYAYEYVLNNNDKVKAKRRGVVRATSVGYNINYTSGDTKEMTKFKQIAGFGGVKEGYTLKQNNDAGLGVSLGYHSIDYFEGSCSYLIKMTQKGIVTYGLMNMSGRMYDLGEYNDYYAFRCGLGFGAGIHFAHRFECIVFAKYIAEMLDELEFDEEEESTGEKVETIAHKFNIGAKLSANIYYPLQLFFQIDNTTGLLYGSEYQTNYNKLLDRNYPSRTGFSFSVGLTYNL